MNRLLLSLWLLTLPLGTFADTRALVLQSTPTDCGPAALATLLRFYLDVPTTEAEAMRLARYDRKSGTTLAGLQAAAEGKACAADSFLMTYSTLKAQLAAFPAPVIVRMLNPAPHFVVLLALDGGYAYLADPGLGNLVVPKGEFRRRWYAPEAAEGFVFIAAAPGGHVDAAQVARTVAALRRGLRHLADSQPSPSDLMH